MTLMELEKRLMILEARFDALLRIIERFAIRVEMIENGKVKGKNDERDEAT